VSYFKREICQLQTYRLGRILRLTTPLVLKYGYSFGDEMNFTTPPPGGVFFYIHPRKSSGRQQVRERWQHRETLSTGLDAAMLIVWLLNFNFKLHPLPKGRG